jgi:hypothetical protein
MAGEEGNPGGPLRLTAILPVRLLLEPQSSNTNRPLADVFASPTS